MEVLVLVAFMLLVSAHASNYESLTPDLRSSVDKSLKKTRDHYPNHHVAYFSMKLEVIESTSNIHVLLKVSKCRKSPGKADQCVPQEKILYLIDCLVCETNKELVDCRKLKDVKKNKEPRKCEVNHLFGGNALLHKAEDSHMGCLGCM